MATLHDYKAYLSDRQLVHKKRLPYFIRWAANYLTFCEKSGVKLDSKSLVQAFLLFMAKSREEWQVKQARETRTGSPYCLNH